MRSKLAISLENDISWSHREWNHLDRLYANHNEIDLVSEIIKLLRSNHDILAHHGYYLAMKLGRVYQNPVITSALLSLPNDAEPIERALGLPHSVRKEDLKIPARQNKES